MPLRNCAALLVSSVGVFNGWVALSQNEPAAREATAAAQQEDPEEVVVRGRRLTELRSEVQLKREHAYGIFNALNSDDDFDVYCRKESRAGTNVPQYACRAQFEGRIASRAAGEYMAALKWACPMGVTQDCIFSEASSAGISAAQGVEGEAPIKRKEFNDEIVRLANENDEFAQAILDFYEAHQQYETARKRRRGD